MYWDSELKMVFLAGGSCNVVFTSKVDYEIKGSMKNMPMGFMFWVFIGLIKQWQQQQNKTNHLKSMKELWRRVDSLQGMNEMSRT